MILNTFCWNTENTTEKKCCHMIYQVIVETTLLFQLHFNGMSTHSWPFKKKAKTFWNINYTFPAVESIYFIQSINDKNILKDYYFKNKGGEIGHKHFNL